MIAASFYSVNIFQINLNLRLPLAIPTIFQSADNDRSKIRELGNPFSLLKSISLPTHVVIMLPCI